MRRPIHVAAVVLLASLSSGQEGPGEVVVYVGRPEIKYSGLGSLQREELSEAESRKYIRRIVRRQGRYYWASREDRELTLLIAGPYATFTNDAGFIKLMNPLWDTARQKLRQTDPMERFDYVEVLHKQLGLVLYWGRGSGTALRE